MTRWKLTFEYDGQGFCGWQKQAHDLSVQEVVEEALFKLTQERPLLHVAGRTDAGVHALGQVAHVDLEKELTAETIQNALNFYVRPHRVVVLDVEAVPPTFHARFSAERRHYRYCVLNRKAPPALFAHKVWHIRRPLALYPMQQAASLLLGKHDFSTFRARYCQASSPHRTLDRLEIRSENDRFYFETTARSYLYHQVRNMVGTLVLVGHGLWSLERFSDAFKACDRRAGGPTAPADGLYFLKVDYAASRGDEAAKPQSVLDDDTLDG